MIHSERETARHYWPFRGPLPCKLEILLVKSLGTTTDETRVRMKLRERLLKKFPAMEDISEGFLLWVEARDLDDAGALVARWLRGSLRYLPWDSNTPYDETLEAEGFAEAMAEINDLSMVTLRSQPGKTDHREYVELAIEDDALPLVREVAGEADVEVEVMPDKRKPAKKSTPVGLRKGKPHARLDWSRKDVSALFGYGSLAMAATVSKGQYTLLSVYDRQFARRGRVQYALERLAEVMNAKQEQDVNQPEVEQE